MRHDVVRQDRIGGDAHLLGEVLREGGAIAQPPHRRQVLLCVELQSLLADVAVEMDR